MSQTPERLQDERQDREVPREEAALPVAAAPESRRVADLELEKRAAVRVLGATIFLAVVMSTVLEFGGWQRAFADMPTPHVSIPPLAFLRGVWDTTLGAIGVGAAAASAALLLPSTWRRLWRRVPAAFAVGASAFIAFLSFVTF